MVSRMGVDLVDAAVRSQDDALALLVDWCEPGRLEDDITAKSL